MNYEAPFGKVVLATKSTEGFAAAYIVPTQNTKTRDAPKGLVGVSDDQVAGVRVAYLK
jgi:hypothetical protein